MTTIAYRDGIMAGDTRLSDDSMIWTDRCRKVWKLRDGSLLGAAGDSESCMMLVEGLKKGILIPTIPVLDGGKKDIHAIRVTSNGRVYFFEGFHWSPVPEKFLAIGSGGKAAMALLRFGASAVEAVRGGISVDPYSGGRVQVVKLKGRK